MIRPYLKDDALLSSIRNAVLQPSRFYLWWLGQSGFLIRWQDEYVLLDPYLSDSLTHKYAGTEKPHIRMTELVIDPARLNFVNVVTSSHNHTDHLDAATLVPLLEANPNIQLIIPEANRDFVVQRLNCARNFPRGLNAGEQVSAGRFTFYGVPAAHNLLDKNTQGQHLYLGYVIAFGSWKIYHSGDTLWYDGLESILQPFAVDIALLPINGHKPERKVAGNLNAEEAARLGREISARLVIPCHYDMFTFNTADPAQFAKASERWQQPYRVLQCGEPWNSDQLP